MSRGGSVCDDGEDGLVSLVRREMLRGVEVVMIGRCVRHGLQ